MKINASVVWSSAAKHHSMDDDMVRGNRSFAEVNKSFLQAMEISVSLETRFTLQQ